MPAPSEEKNLSKVKPLQAPPDTKKMIPKKLIEGLDIPSLEKAFAKMDEEKTLVIPFGALPKTTGLTEEELLAWEQANISQYGEGAISYLLAARNFASNYIPGASYFGSFMRSVAGETIAGAAVSPTNVMEKLRKIVSEQKTLQEAKPYSKKEKAPENKRMSLTPAPSTIFKSQKDNKTSEKNKQKLNTDALNQTVSYYKDGVTENENLKQRNFEKFVTFCGTLIGAAIGLFVGFLLIPFTLGISFIVGPIIGAIIGGVLTYSCHKELDTPPPPTPESLSPISPDIPLSPIHTRLRIKPTLSINEDHQIKNSPKDYTPTFTTKSQEPCHFAAKNRYEKKYI